MNASGYMFIVIAMSFIAAFPYKASAHKHIPFYVTYKKEDGDKVLQLQCGGPWLRTTGLVSVSPGADHAKFYSAEVDAFSPYGKWSCSICPPDEGGPTSCSGPIIARTHFHLKKDDDEVNLTMTKDSLTSDLSDDGDTITARATLGDDNTKPKRDRDTFTFNFGPNPGDRVVTVTLEDDPEAGHTGEEATLILRDGASTIETVTDVLPIEITTTLASDGEYRLIVQQHNIPEGGRFRGSYFLSVTSGLGDIEQITPSEDVEQ